MGCSGEEKGRRTACPFASLVFIVQAGNAGQL